MNLSTVKKEDIPEIVSTMIDEASSKVSRLVIDSFTAMTQAFKEPIDARVVVYTLLDKIVRQLGCTSLKPEL